MPHVIRINNARYPELVKAMHKLGYVLCAHGWHHREIWRRQGDQATLDVEHEPLRNTSNRAKDSAELNH